MPCVTMETRDAEVQMYSDARGHLVMRCARKVDEGEKVLPRTQKPTLVTLNNCQKLEMVKVLLASLGDELREN